MHTGEVLALRITDDRTPDCRCLEGLVSDAGKAGAGISRVMADGAYDSRQIFTFLDGLDIDPVVRVHRNSVVSANKDALQGWCQSCCRPAEPMTGGGIA